VAEVPRNAESLCNLVRSTLKLVAFNGIFTLVPLEDVSVMVFTSTMNERRFVLGGGVSGAAVNVKLSVAVPPPPGGGVFFDPLHETREMTDIESSKARTFRKFMSPHGERVPSTQLAEARASQVQLYAWTATNICKTKAHCSTAKCETAIRL
jgi:hypothetical protein